MRGNRLNGKTMMAIIDGTPRHADLTEAMTGDAKAIVEHEDAIVHTLFHKTVLAFLRSPEMEKILRQICTDTVKDMAAEHIAARVPEIDSRIRAAVAERFDSAVESVVRAELDAAVADVKRRLSK